MTNKEEREAHRSSQDLVNLFSVVLRTAHIHEHNNIAVTMAIDKFLYLLNHLIEIEQGISLGLVGEFFYMNGGRSKNLNEEGR